MTRFREDGRLREWTADPTDPLPQGLAEIAQLTPEEFSTRRGRVALAGLFPEENRSGITDEHLLRLLQIWPALAWAKGTEVDDLEPYIESTFRAIKGEKPEAVAGSLGMNPEEYKVWRDEVTKDLCTVVSLNGLARASGLREAPKPKKTTPKINGTKQQIAEHRAVSRTWVGPSWPIPTEEIHILAERTGSRNADYARVVAARNNQYLFEALLSDHLDFIRFKANSYFLPGGENKDLIQEGMIGFYKAVRDYDGMRSAFSSFVELCVTRQMITAIKTATRGKHGLLNNYVSFDLNPSGDGINGGSNNMALGDSLPSKEPSVEAIVVSKEGLKRLVGIIKSELSLFEERVIILFLEDVSYERIAVFLDTDTKSVDNALQRVKKKILLAMQNKDFVSPLLYPEFGLQAITNGGFKGRNRLSSQSENALSPRNGLYSGLVDLDRIPEIKTNDSMPKRELKIVEDNIIEFEGNHITLVPHEVFLLNALLISRDRAMRAVDFFELGYFPESLNCSSRNSSFVGVKNRMLRAILIIPSTGRSLIKEDRPGRTLTKTYQLDPNIDLTITDLRQEN